MFFFLVNRLLWRYACHGFGVVLFPRNKRNKALKIRDVNGHYIRLQSQKAKIYLQVLSCFKLPK